MIKKITISEFKDGHNCSDAESAYINIRIFHNGPLQSGTLVELKIFAVNFRALCEYINLHASKHLNFSTPNAA